MKTFTLDAHTARVEKFKARRDELGLFGAIKSEGGAIDLASIMVGVLVIGIIGGIIAATVFAVIPWSQDEAAKGALDSVNQAESVAYAFSAEDGSATFASKADLVSGVASVDGSSLLQDDADLTITLTNGGKGYTAEITSETGNVFHIVSTSPSVVVDGPVAGGIQ